MLNPLSTQVALVTFFNRPYTTNFFSALKTQDTLGIFNINIEYLIFQCKLKSGGSDTFFNSFLKEGIKGLNNKKLE